MSSPPTTLGKYQIIREIARSNDIVYEAYDPLMNRRVALKELAVPNGSTPQQKEERLKRFLREAKAAGSLAHPNIVTIYEVGEDAGRHYLVMEYLDGHTLRNELDAKGFLPEDEAIKVADSVLRALEYAHQNGVIHRDIKPENIQMLSDGRIKLTDFGIARLTFEPNLTMDGQVFGTPSYMSPEQVVGKDIDVRSDLFSVGVVLYEMLAGQKPFGGDSVVAITYAITNKEPDRPQQIKQALWQVISKALDKSPQMRYSSSSEMISALESAKFGGATQMQVQVQIQAPPQITNPYLPQPPSNPFLTPYPGGSYQNQPQQPLQYPYNPYGGPAQAPPNSNPYDPYGQTNLPGQQYQPHQQTYLPGGTNMSPGGPPFLQTPPNIPIYYPPPPRRPVLNAEQRATAVKWVLAFLVIGVVFMAIVVALIKISDPTPDGSNLQPTQSGSTGSDPNSSDSGVPISNDTDTSGMNEAPSLERQGVALVEKADGEDSDSGSSDYNSAVTNFERAANDYSKGGNKAESQKCSDEAAETRVRLARILEGSDREQARQILFRARDEVTPHSLVGQEIDEELTKLT